MDVQTLLDSIPTPSTEEMAARHQLARHYTLIFLRRGLAPRDDQAQ